MIRVMVVDDTDHVRDMLAEMLALDGFDVVAAAPDATTAIGMVDAADPDIVVMDLRMPGIDGLDCTRAIKLGRPGQAVILYTAYLDEQTETAAREAGVTLCVAKGGGIPELEREISRLALEVVEAADPRGPA